MKKLFSILLALTLALGMNAAFAESSPYAGGTGTAEDPYQIATAEQLLALSAAVNDGSVNGYPGTCFVLTEDIDLSGVAWQPIGHLDIENQNNMSVMFMGVLDGQGHTVSNMTFNSDYPVCGVGIVGINLGGEVKNLNAKNINVNCTHEFSMAIGDVVGFNMGGSVHDITLTGENSVAGINCIGGIVGGNSGGTVANCTVEGTTVRVLGDNDFSSGRIIQRDMAECGGLVIGGSLGSIDNCTARGKVIAEGNEPVGMGGIAGCLQMMDTVTNCTADVEITSAKGGHAIGGLCGYAGTHSNGNIIAEKEGIVTTKYPGIIDNCNVTVKMDIPGATHVGGLVGTGLFFFGEDSAFKVTNCSVKGSITGAVTPGAVAGRAVNSTIESCSADVTLDGEALAAEVGETTVPYESDEQGEEAEDAA